MGRKDSYIQLVSKAGEEVLEGKTVWNSYPRPQLRRDNYWILKDGWKLNGKEIRVPFPPQSLLSRYKDKVDKCLEYTISLGEFKKREKMRTILHFGAVDQKAEVYLGENFIGKHEGGYLPFCFDITNHLSEECILTVKADDSLDKKYPYGKQCEKRGGMWYTPVSGIWQNVWVEYVPERYVESIRITPDMSAVDIVIEISGRSEVHKETSDNIIKVKLHTGEVYEQSFAGDRVHIDFSAITTATGEKYEAQNWSPENPYLYEAEIVVGEDKVETYFALRKIEIKDINGVNRVCLNGSPVFLNGVLDQGYFCDGIFLPAEEEEYKRDIERMKELGFNMLRKHIKIEPECFYYYCDKLGMLVVQDMVNNGEYSFIRDTALPTLGRLRRNDKRSRSDAETKAIFEKHMTDTQMHLYNHPSVIMYTIFNEGWGQFDSDRMYKTAKANDDTRLYDATSGWFIQKDSDFDSYHVYFKKKSPRPGERPMFLSEFGGCTYVVPEHVFAENKSYGYKTCRTAEELDRQIRERYESLVFPVIKAGACGCVYTQLSDVEDEVNGFYTYDRKVCKVRKEAMQSIADKIKNLLKE